jgi:predicted membrane chloride channel (bestrophin family)
VRCANTSQLYTTVPFASVIVFFALYLGIVNNQAYSRFVRFNGQVRLRQRCRLSSRSFSCVC